MQAISANAVTKIDFDGEPVRLGKTKVCLPKRNGSHSYIHDWESNCRICPDIARFLYIFKKESTDISQDVKAYFGQVQCHPELLIIATDAGLEQESMIMAKIHGDVQQTCGYGYNPLILACQNRLDDVAIFLLDFKTVVSNINDCAMGGDTAILHALEPSYYDKKISKRVPKEINMKLIIKLIGRAS